MTPHPDPPARQEKHCPALDHSTLLGHKEPGVREDTTTMKTTLFLLLLQSRTTLIEPSTFLSISHGPFPTGEVYSLPLSYRHRNWGTKRLPTLNQPVGCGAKWFETKTLGQVKVNVRLTQNLFWEGIHKKVLMLATFAKNIWG